MTGQRIGWLVRIGLQRLEKRTYRNHTKFNKRKFLLLGHDKPTQQYSLDINWLESSFAETDLGVLVDTKRHTSQQSAPAVKKAIQILGRISSIYWATLARA